MLATAGTDGIMGRSASTKGMIQLWEPGKMMKLKELEVQKYVKLIRFIADGTRLVSSSAAGDTAESEKRITLWEVSSRGAP